MEKIDFSSLITNYNVILNRVHAASEKVKSPNEVVTIAVSKLQPIEKIQFLYELGHRDFGENYVQELIEKSEYLEKKGCHGIRWHFIGHLQSNKTKALLPHVYCIHTVDSKKLALEISKRWDALNKKEPLPVFLQVNIDQESSKSGFDLDYFKSSFLELAQVTHLSIQGLMCIPTRENTRPAFAKLRELELQCRPITQGKLSMGMSEDFESAIQEGATHIRIGTALFGSRQAL